MTNTHTHTQSDLTSHFANEDAEGVLMELVVQHHGAGQ